MYVITYKKPINTCINTNHSPCHWAFQSLAHPSIFLIINTSLFPYFYIFLFSYYIFFFVSLFPCFVICLFHYSHVPLFPCFVIFMFQCFLIPMFLGFSKFSSSQPSKRLLCFFVLDPSYLIYIQREREGLIKIIMIIKKTTTKKKEIK